MIDETGKPIKRPAVETVTMFRAANGGGVFHTRVEAENAHLRKSLRQAIATGFDHPNYSIDRSTDNVMRSFRLTPVCEADGSAFLPPPTTSPVRQRAKSPVPYFLALSVASFIAGYISGGGLFS